MTSLCTAVVFGFLAGLIARAIMPGRQAMGFISTTLLGGRTFVRVYDASSPGAGFEPTEPDLTDVYFSTMAGHIGQHRANPQPAAAA